MTKRLTKEGKMALRKEIGTRLRGLRKSFGLSIDVLAEQLGITPSHIGLMERGERGLSAEFLISVSALFQCSSDFLLTGKDFSGPSIKFGSSPAATTIDLLLNDHAKQKLSEFIMSLSLQQNANEKASDASQQEN